jgi:hypothetical protein
MRLYMRPPAVNGGVGVDGRRMPRKCSVEILAALLGCQHKPARVIRAIAHVGSILPATDAAWTHDPGLCCVLVVRNGRCRCPQIFAGASTATRAACPSRRRLIVTIMSRPWRAPGDVTAGERERSRSVAVGAGHRGGEVRALPPNAQRAQRHQLFAFDFSVLAVSSVVDSLDATSRPQQKSALAPAQRRRLHRIHR